MRMRKFPLLVCLCALLVGSPASAATITFDGDGLGLLFQPIDGLSLKGVTFGFSLPLDGFYNSTAGPGATNVVNLDDQTLEGSAFGELSMLFAAPVDSLKFATALDRPNATLTPGLTVNLYDSLLNLISTTPVTTTTLDLFTEAVFTYSGTAVKKATVTFDATNGNPEAGGRFAMDNLSYTEAPEPPAPAPVPEPASLTLLGLGAAGLRLYRRRWTV
jgi:hypothetical protein